MNLSSIFLRRVEVEGVDVVFGAALARRILGEPFSWPSFAITNSLFITNEAPSALDVTSCPLILKALKRGQISNRSC